MTISSLSLPQRTFTNRVVFALIMSAITTSMVVLVAVIAQVGMSKQLFDLWLRTFVVDYLIVVPTVLLFAPMLQRKLFRFCPGSLAPTKASRIRFALVMALLTVSFACFFGLVVNMGFSKEMVSRFALVFPVAYTVAVPFIVIIAPLLQKRIDIALAS